MERDIKWLYSILRGGSRGRVQGVCTPPWGEPLFFVFTFKICLPHQSVTPFLSGAPPPKKNPGSASDTAMISFKLLTFCKTLLNRICRRPALYKQQWEVSQIIKIKRKKERYFWVKAQFFLVIFTLSSKNIVIQSQLNRTEPTLKILHLPSVKEWRKWPFLQQKSLFTFNFHIRPTVI